MLRNQPIYRHFAIICCTLPSHRTQFWPVNQADQPNKTLQ